MLPLLLTAGALAGDPATTGDAAALAGDAETEALCAALRSEPPAARAARDALDRGADADGTCRWSEEIRVSKAGLTEVVLGIVLPVLIPVLWTPTEPRTVTRASTPLVLALSQGTPELMGALLEAGADPNRASPDGDRPLRLAAVRDLQQPGAFLPLLAEAGARWTAEPRPDLHWLEAVAAEPRVLDSLLDLGLPIDARTVEGRTLLVRAVESGDRDRVDLLLERGADVHGADGWGRTPMIAAFDRGDLATVDLLVGRGWRLAREPRGHDSLVHLAVEAGDAGLVQRALDLGVPVDEAGDFGRTAVSTAIAARRFDLARILLEAGADPGREEFFDETPLRTAVEAADREALALLLPYAGELERQDVLRRALSDDPDLAGFVVAQGVTPDDLALGFALAWGTKEEVDWLVAHGAPRSDAALHDAVESGEVERVRWALALDLDLDAPRRMPPHETPLQLAESLGLADIADLLIGAGARPDAPESLVEALRRGDRDHARRLLEVGVRVGGHDLVAAAALGDVALFEQLLDRVATPAPRDLRRARRAAADREMRRAVRAALAAARERATTR